MADAFENAILRLLSRIGPGETIGPAEVAREASQETGVQWEQLLRAVRRAAVKLALEGRAVILLKGEPVDPEHFRGIYRIGGGDYFTPRKEMPAHTPPPPPSLAPPRDYRPEPRPYTPPALPEPAPVATPAPSPKSVRLAVHVNPPAAQAAPPPPEPPVTAAPPPQLGAELRPDLEPQHPISEHVSLENGPEQTPAQGETQWAIDEGTPVTRFELDPRRPNEDVLDDDVADFLGESHENKAEEEVVSPLPLGSALSFDDDEYEDEDAHRAPRSATLDDIASQLERYLAAQLNDTARGNAEIGDDIVRLPRQQDE